jgi:hypothetical protein
MQQQLTQLLKLLKFLGQEEQGLVLLLLLLL